MKQSCHVSVQGRTAYNNQQNHQADQRVTNITQARHRQVEWQKSQEQQQRPGNNADNKSM
jgi:hypothetical protein